MKATEFWKIYAEEFKQFEGPGLMLHTYPLTGDHGYFEMSIYRNSDGVWCIDKTIERCNTPSCMCFANEDEAFDYLLRTVEWYTGHKRKSA